MTGSTAPTYSLALSLLASGGARKAKNLSRVREVCARVEDDGVRPYLVVRGGHCGPARLLPIIMANESTGAVWHNPRAWLTVVSGCGRSPHVTDVDVRGVVRVAGDEVG
ncbi:hypothetical protein GCM10010270_63930 [Streptomyces violaceus]|nr:hypothetical protein GCM10010270_63930 [Streptomyces janthinus]